MENDINNGVDLKSTGSVVDDIIANNDSVLRQKKSQGGEMNDPESSSADLNAEMEDKIDSFVKGVRADNKPQDSPSPIFDDSKNSDYKDEVISSAHGMYGRRGPKIDKEASQPEVDLNSGKHKLTLNSLKGGKSDDGVDDYLISNKDSKLNDAGFPKVKGKGIFGNKVDKSSNIGNINPDLANIEVGDNFANNFGNSSDHIFDDIGDDVMDKGEPEDRSSEDIFGMNDGKKEVSKTQDRKKGWSSKRAEKKLKTLTPKTTLTENSSDKMSGLGHARQMGGGLDFDKPAIHTEAKKKVKGGRGKTVKIKVGNKRDWVLYTAIILIALTIVSWAGAMYLFFKY